MEDTLHHKDLRVRLVQNLRAKGISNPDVLAAIERVPRHLFVEGNHSASELYQDVPLEIGQGQTISQPYTVAFQTQLLEAGAHDKILEIGTGSGYQSAVLFELGAEVFSIERQNILYTQTKQKLVHLGYSAIHTFFGDGNSGLPEQAPFNRILITAESRAMPQELIDQLRDGGIMVLPVQGRMKKVIRVSENNIRVEDHGSFLFVPMLPGTVR